jgi:hypothetical protein
MAMRFFLASEEAAITTDWVVAAAAVTAMGLATVSLVSGGMEDISGGITTTLSEQLETGFVAATAGLTVTDVWNDPSASMRDLLNVEQFSFSTVVDLDPDAEGILFETGANVWGTILYQHDGVLYLQSGRGNGYGETAERGEASWRVTGGTATIEGSLDANGGLALMINGEVVDQSSFTASRLAGGNPGSIAGANSGVAVNRGGFNQNDPGYPGVTEVVLFEDQTTGHELVPLD